MRIDEGRQSNRNFPRKMKSFVQFLTTPTADTPGTTLLLHFDSRRYLIGNVSEGTQRAGTQMGARLIKTTCLFLTGKTEWANVGGMLGMVLTLADGISSQLEALIQSAKGKKKAEAQKDAEQMRKGLQIVGPRNLAHMIATSRRFIFRQGLPINPVEVKGNERLDKPFWEDEHIQVWALATAPEESGPGSDRSVSPSARKRSFDEFRDTTDATRAGEGSSASPLETNGISPEKEEEYDNIRQGVVGAMFNSDWKFDHLLEMPLSQVQLPASLFVKNSQTNKLEEYKGPMPSTDPSVGSLIVWVRRPWPGALIRSLPPTKPAKEAISYVVRNHFQRGKFQPQKAQELGVQKSQYKLLTSGNTVTTDAGRTVSPDDVLAPGRQGAGFAVIEIPSLDYVAPTVSKPEWKDSSIMDGVKTFIWILGPDVLAHPALQAFFGEMADIEHIVSSIDCCPNELAMESMAMANKRLNQIDPERYLLPIYNNERTPQVSFRSANPKGQKIPVGLHRAKKGLTVNLEPLFSINEPNTKSLDLEADDQQDPASQLSISEEVKALRDEAYHGLERDQSKLAAWASKLPNSKAEVITLGTGSALPSKYRNVSATLVRIPGVGSYLLDCGENTLGQLQRIYSSSKLIDVFKELRMIWISHLHADHHLGTASVIRAWYQVNYPNDATSNPLPASLNGQAFNPDELAKRPRLAVISDTGMLDWLAEYSQAENFGHHLIMPFYISNSTWASRSELQWAPMLDAIGPLSAIDKKHYESLLGFSDIQSVAVQHCHGARAVSVTFPDGFKVSYSGDCRPSKNFAKIGRDSTVLIHEATFDDELKSEARAKQHSTTSEALAVASEMRAKSVVLTHFSQRYQKIPVMDSVEGMSDDEIDKLIEPEPYRGTFRRGRKSHGDRPINEDEDEIMQEAMLDMVGEGSEFSRDRRPRSRSRQRRRSPNGTEAAIAGGQESNSGPPAETSEHDVPSEKATVGETHVKVRSKDMKVCVAFDYMRIRVGDIAKMEYFTPALMKLFEEPDEKTGKKGEGDGVSADG